MSAWWRSQFLLTSPLALPRPTGARSVGSYTLMMDWAQCRDYCTYFPHSVELGHTFSFADILDVDTMECLNMNNQYTPGNVYAMAIFFLFCNLVTIL